ncbi:Ubiquinol-cytochrome c reductase cytochrome b subunit [Mycobacteroides abscessus subsp. abscessus]|nr:Ubiquinol-cytochrome c reductase cytochrome b subunit [Mycobacteroides abscessus subsp. abscessus]
MHQPLGPVDDHGHPIPLEYQGAPVPKKMNKLGSAGKPGTGSFLFPDPPQESERNFELEHAAEQKQLEALAKAQEKAAQEVRGGSGGHIAKPHVRAPARVGFTPKGAGAPREPRTPGGADVDYR